MLKYIKILIGKLGWLKNQRFKDFIIFLMMTLLTFSIIYLADRWISLVTDQHSIFLHFICLSLITISCGLATLIFLTKKAFIDNNYMTHLAFIVIMNAVGVIVFSMIKYGIQWGHIAIEYRTIYLPTLILFSLPIVFWAAVQALLEIPKLKFASYKFDELEGAIGKKFGGNRGIIWHLENIFEEPVQYRIKVNPDRLNEDLGELFRQVVAYCNFDPGRKYTIPFVKRGKPYGWVFEVRDSGLLSTESSFLNPFKSISRRFLFFKKPPEELRRSVQQSRSIYVTCIID